jgi:S-methylmethionine-dependent homocysteine/selenocysteine methylase
MKSLTVLDGGMGRELKRIGAPFSQPLWSAQALIESPTHVTVAHQRFIDAGAEIIIANSYACVPFHLGSQRYQEQGPLLAKKAAQLAAEAAHSCPNVQVAGCLPPPMGSYRPDLFDRDEAKVIYQQLYDAQLEYVDLWIVETLASIEEFSVAHKVLENDSRACLYAFSLSDQLSDDAMLRSGELVSEVTKALLHIGVDTLLFNCSIPEVMLRAVVQANKVAAELGKALEIGVYANNFTAIEPDHQANNALQAERTLTPDEYLNYAKQWKEAGATIIGGCCGIGPEHIAAIKNWKVSLETS